MFWLGHVTTIVFESLYWRSRCPKLDLYVDVSPVGVCSLLSRYSADGVFEHLDLIENLGPAMLLNNRLTFLGKPSI